MLFFWGHEYFIIGDHPARCRTYNIPADVGALNNLVLYEMNELAHRQTISQFINAPVAQFALAVVHNELCKPDITYWVF
jgi:hypothetical protein